MGDLDARVQALEAKVEELQSRNEIQELRFRYHLAVNEKKPEMIQDLFAENGEIDFAHLGKAAGRSRLNTFYQQALSDLVPFVKQFIHNHIITLKGDTGTGISYLEPNLSLTERAFWSPLDLMTNISAKMGSGNFAR